MQTLAFRVDASNQIGSGHLRRCLTLANFLKKQNVQVIFVCRETGGLTELITQQGFSLRLMKGTSEGQQKIEQTDVPLEYQNWLGSSQADDAEEFIKLIKADAPDWVLTDHYALGSVWEEGVKQSLPFCRLLVIDDLANRKHLANILLDQSYLRRSEDYANFVPTSCQCLTGVDYCLIRDEFNQIQRQNQADKTSVNQKLNLVITLGGVDADNWTGKILNALKHFERLDKNLSLEVIMGTNAPHLQEVEQTLAALPCKTKLWVNTNQMAKILAGADVAITAAGTTVWELCLLDVPFVLLKTAENQQKAFSALASQAPKTSYESPENFVKALEEFSMADWQNIQSVLPQTFCKVDGKGVERVYKAMLSIELA